MKFEITKDTSNEEFVNILRRWYNWQTILAGKDDKRVSFKGLAWVLWNVNVCEDKQCVDTVLEVLLDDDNLDSHTIRNFVYILVGKCNKRLSDLMEALKKNGYDVKLKNLMSHHINDRMPTGV